jgi:ATP-dependent Clp protease ATP-binding subunit ClpA
MFERFTAAARSVVVNAQDQARSLHHDQVLAEHLLLGVLAERDSISARVLGDLGVEHERLAREVAALGTADDEALRAIGIDLAAVRQRAEAAFGDGALDRPTRARRIGLVRRALSSGGHLRFSQSAKRALEHSLRQALALQHHEIRVDHLLLGLLADDHDPAGHVLQRLGLDPADVRARVRTQLQQAA